MIPSADMIREMAEDRFLQFTEELATTVIEEVEEPIDYHRITDQPADDNDPGLPFFPNLPSSFRYYPLLIHSDDSHHAAQVVAPFIYYRNQGQEVVGTMGRDKPLYAAPVYLSTPNPTHLPIPITNTQLLQFSRESPRAYAIDETLRRLEDPRIDAEVSRLRQKAGAADQNREAARQSPTTGDSASERAIRCGADDWGHPGSDGEGGPLPDTRRHLRPHDRRTDTFAVRRTPWA